MTIEKKDDKESPCQIPLLMLSRPNCLPVHHAVANIGVIYLTASQPRYKHWHLLDFVMVRQVDQNDIFNWQEPWEALTVQLNTMWPQPISVIIFHNQRHYIAIPTSLTYQLITVDVGIPLCWISDRLLIVKIQGSVHADLLTLVLCSVVFSCRVSLKRL